MHQQETNPADGYKLSQNNSVITLPNGQKYQLEIDYALLNFFDVLPPDTKIEDLDTAILSIQDELMNFVPDDYPHKQYKAMHKQLTACAVFFKLLFSKGGHND